MKKTTLKKFSNRLSQYTALSAAVAGVAEVSGQESGPTIVDLDISGTLYNLDMDGDGNADFRLNNTVFQNLFLLPFATGAEALGSAKVDGGNTFIYPFALNSGDNISAGTVTWFNNSYQSMVVSSTVGNWGDGVNPVINKFLGLRFQISGQTHYGWAKLSTDVRSEDDITGNVILHSYYYNPIANDVIQAGATNTLSIKDNAFADIKIFAKNKLINILNLQSEVAYSIYDISGKEIASGLTRSKNESIDIQGISSGIFILNIINKTNGDFLSKKIVIK